MSKQKKEIEDIKNILASLPLISKYEDTINQTANDIARNAAFASNNQRNQAKPCTQKQAEKEMNEFLKKAIGLHEKIEKMHKTTLSEFDEYNVMHPSYLQHVLEELIKVAGRKEIIFKNLSCDKQIITKIQAHQLTIYLANVYKRLTGFEPSRNYDSYKYKEKGAFPHFVQNIFNALEIKHSGISQAVELIKKSNGKTD